ncbi:MAG: ATP phosphoribosyltransferase regulatory subunit [Comamonadaceae bacterium]|nr:ATP phosphoribosyltransferase regulatory subunit [Comamonadaceae bacterium]
MPLDAAGAAATWRRRWPRRTRRRCDALARGAPADARATALRALLRLYGGDEVLDAARDALPARAPVRARAGRPGSGWPRHLRRPIPDVRVGFDLADMSGYAYYSGARFAHLRRTGRSDALARGGRYDEVGAVFGRNRPAVGFSLDLKALAERARRGAGAGRDARALGRGRRRCARRCAAARRAARRWSCVLPGPRARRRRSSTATASWSRSTAAGCCAAL